MTKDFSDDPLDDEDRRKVRKMLTEWKEDAPHLKKLAWVMKNYKLVLAFIAMGALTNARELIGKIMGGL